MFISVKYYEVHEIVVSFNFTDEGRIVVLYKEPQKISVKNTFSVYIPIF